MSHTGAHRLARLLALVPYVAARPGISFADLATEFGVTASQIQADLFLLSMCGRPGYYPNDLIDVAIDEDGGTATIGYDAGIDRPVRLSGIEAVSMMAGLRALADLPELVDTDAVASALAKLEAGAGPTAGVQLTVDAAPPVTAVLREALQCGKRLLLRYFTASRGQLTERLVDPIRLALIDGQTYLIGYCHRAEAERTFRADRIDMAELTDDDIEIPQSSARPAEQLLDLGAQTESVTVALAPGARWVADYYQSLPAEQTEAPPGYLTVRLPVSTDEWLIQLALSLGGGLIICDRDDLAAQVHARALAALAAYDAVDTA